MKKEDIIRMAREAKLNIGPAGMGQTVWGGDAELERFAALVAAAERKSKPHTLGNGEMEIILRREHNGELFEYRYRFTREQVLHGTPDMIENIAGRLNAAAAQNIHKRSQA
jgi:hypothetical protein